LWIVSVSFPTMQLRTQHASAERKAMSAIEPQSADKSERTR
jgi:hypothetical protein